MTRVSRSLFVGMLLAAALIKADHLLARDLVTVDLTQWSLPDLAAVGDDPFGRLVKYGHALVTNTANEIGPTVADPNKRFSGNNLACQNCHLQAGTQPYAMPLTGIWGQFPQYRGREGAVATIEDRINGCMQRSMNGRPLPLDSNEMKAFTAYMRWLSTGIPTGASLIGAGTLRIKEPQPTPAAVPLSTPMFAVSAMGLTVLASVLHMVLVIRSHRSGVPTATTTARV
jgi:cytochrome c